MRNEAKLYVLLGALAFFLGCGGRLQPLAARTDATRALERKVFELVNDYRISRGMKRLAWNNLVSDYALVHSQNMAQNKVSFSHTGFEARMNEIAVRQPFRASAENIAMNSGYRDPAREFVEGWLKSPGHLHNIEGNFNLTGIGIAQSPDGTYYATQIFVLSR
jgi:uncharacterized protein YkwD